MLSNLDFADNTSFMLFLFFLIIDLHFLITPIISQIFNPIAELVIPVGIPSKESKAKNEIHPVIVEAKIKNCST